MTSIEPSAGSRGRRAIVPVIAVVVACLSMPGLAALPSGSSPKAGATEQVVEFYNAALQHYFISANSAEIANLDAGAFNRAWQRTGESFAAWDIVGAPATTVPVCRFFGTDRYRSDGTRIGPNSHFYTADPAECAFVTTGYQTIAGDGLSYPAWTYENNAFAVVAPAGGTCPATTTALYRTYNNGLHGDPGHRYSTRADLLQGMPGWTFEGLVMCLPQSPTPTAVGVAVGAPVAASIGAAGGSLTSADGKLTLTFPAGALATTTTVGIQPITNHAHGAIGSAYRLTPDGQTFATPVTLTFRYVADDLAGTAASFLGAAFQTPQGYWQWMGPAAVDAAARTVSVTSTHFTDMSSVKGILMRPGSATIRPGTALALHVRACYADTSDTGDLTALGYDCDLDQGPDGILTVDEWSANGRPGGDAVFGTVAGTGETSGIFTAPGKAPSPPLVAVSARIHVLKSGASDLVVSNITIALDSWTGTATGINDDVTTIATVTWTLATLVDNVAVYKPSGTAAANVAPVGPCTFAFAPPSAVIDPATAPPYNTEGVLTIDFNSTPPSYHGYAFTNWAASLTSPCGPAQPSIGGGPWFGGSGNPFGREASGFLSADGLTIQGSASDTQVPPATYTWKFTRVTPP